LNFIELIIQSAKHEEAERQSSGGRANRVNPRDKDLMKDTHSRLTCNDLLDCLRTL
jgi:hypothetical protein